MKGVVMSADIDFDNLMADDDAADSGRDLVKELRKALKAQSNELKALKTEQAERAKTERSRSLVDVLKEHGAKPGLAKFFPSDTEPTAEAVLGWLKEDGELFGWVPATDVEPDQEQAIRTIAGVEPQAGPIGLAARAAALATPVTDGRKLTQADAKEAGDVAAALLASLGQAK